MAQPLKITISNGNKGTQSQVTESPNAFIGPQAEVKSGQTIAKSVIASQFINAGVSAGKTIVDYGLAMNGDYSGDYVRQDRINNALEVGSALLNIGAAFGSGVVMTGGNILGGVVTGAIAVGNLAVNEVLKVNTYNINIVKQNASAMFNRSRIGKILNNG